MAENLIQEKLKKDLQEFQSYLDKVATSYLETDIDKEIGSTPKTLVFENTILELYRYEGVSDIPLLIVNPLINGYYILDLLPEISFIRFLVSHNLSPYIIRWKNLQEYKKEYNWDYYVLEGIEKSISLVFEREKKPIVLLGHCLGGILSLSYLTTFRDKRIAKYISLNSPVDFSQMGEINRLTSKENLNVDLLVDSFGNIPADYMTASFQFINAAARFNGLMGILYYYFDKEKVRIYKALLQWREDNINMPGEVARTLIKQFFQENNLFKGKFMLAGKKVSFSRLSFPILNIVSQNDDIAPVQSCLALNQKIKNKDLIQTITLPDGHLAISILKMFGIDPKTYWQEIVKWIVK